MSDVDMLLQSKNKFWSLQAAVVQCIMDSQGELILWLTAVTKMAWIPTCSAPDLLDGPALVLELLQNTLSCSNAHVFIFEQQLFGALAS